MPQEQEDLDKAFNKELFIIRNDLYYQQMELLRNGKKELLRVDISYKPHSSLSGDTYSLRKTKNGRLVGFIADAMGKGISAAVTAMAITRFLNYIFDELEEEGDFIFEHWIRKGLKFLQKNLLDEEIISILFVEFDIFHSQIHYASCGMPAFLIVTEEGEMMPIRSNNPPLAIYSDAIRTTTLQVESLVKVLFYSDGLSECPVNENCIYATYLKSDFQESTCVQDFHQKVASRIKGGEDDVTYLYIERVVPKHHFMKLEIQSSYEAVEEALHTISLYLKEHKVSSKTTSELVLTLSELLLNALEHGSFGVDKKRKNYLIEHNLFDEEMARLEVLHKSKKIKISYNVFMHGSKELFEATVKDEGEGFDPKILKNIVINGAKFNGRGFVIIRKLLDHFYFNEKGNAITIQKFLSQPLEL